MVPTAITDNLLGGFAQSEVSCRGILGIVGKTELDILAHALWTTATGIVGRNEWRQRIHLGWLAAWGVCPDLVVFTIPACARIWRVLVGASETLLPDGRGPHFEWVWGLYNCTHSALVFAVCFGACWLLVRKPVLEMLAWAIHIVIDVFTHGGLFAIKFLWPISSVHVDGKRWETPWFLAANHAVLALLYLWLWIRRIRREEPRQRSDSV